LALPHLLADGVVVVGAALDGLIEDGGVRGQPRDRQLVAVALERPAGEELAGDVVEPQALAELVKSLRRFHGFLPDHTAVAAWSSQWPMPAMRLSASDGPQVPGAYSWTGEAVPRIGSTMRHASSTASSREKSVASPRAASPRRRSYGSMSSAHGLWLAISST